MQNNLGVRNIVLIGFFDLPIYDKYFFIKNNIVSEDEILPSSTFDAIGGVIQLVTNKFNIIINLQQLIISVNNPSNDDVDVNRTMIDLVKSADIKNVIALGINFHWHLSDNSVSLSELSRKYFYNEKNELFTKYFNSSSDMFGVYASTEIKDSRLKLDVKPTIKTALNEPIENFIAFAFNFHFDIKNKNENTEVLKYVGDYDFYKRESEKIMTLYK